MRERLGELVPVTRGLGLRRIWAATIDFTPDHLPILGPGLGADGVPIEGVTVASAGGHGMMWGPPSRASRPTSSCGCDRRRRRHGPGPGSVRRGGRSRLDADPIALPFRSRRRSGRDAEGLTSAAAPWFVLLSNKSRVIESKHEPRVVG
jgi:sarcosine oxidase subunit beta